MPSYCESERRLTFDPMLGTSVPLRVPFSHYWLVLHHGHIHPWQSLHACFVLYINTGPNMIIVIPTYIQHLVSTNINPLRWYGDARWQASDSHGNQAKTGCLKPKWDVYGLTRWDNPSGQEAFFHSTCFILKIFFVWAQASRVLSNLRQVLFSRTVLHLHGKKLAAQPLLIWWNCFSAEKYNDDWDA